MDMTINNIFVMYFLARFPKRVQQHSLVKVIFGGGGIENSCTSRLPWVAEHEYASCHVCKDAAHLQAQICDGTLTFVAPGAFRRVC
eukprot:3773728-Amphidinium_carterae.1